MSPNLPTVGMAFTSLGSQPVFHRQKLKEKKRKNNFLVRQARFLCQLGMLVARVNLVHMAIFVSRAEPWLELGLMGYRVTAKL